MKIIKLCALLLTLSFPAASFSHDEPQVQESLSAEQVEEINNFITSVSKQTQRLRLILTDIIQKSGAQSIKNINAQDVRSWALNMQQFLKTIHDMPTQSPHNIALKTCANQYCLEVISTAITLQLTTLPDFLPELHIKRTLEQADDWSALFQIQNKTDQQLIILEQSVKNLGLNTGNKIACQIEVLWKQYQIASKLPWIGTAMVLGAGTWWINRPASLQIINDKEQMVTNAQKAYNWIQPLMSSGIGAGFSFLGQSVFDSYKGLVNNLWKSTKANINDGWNHLKGVPSVLDKRGFEVIDNDDITFESEELIGLEEQINEISPILECCSDLENFIRRGNKPQYGTLLIGPSGCGKTYFARALAGTMRQILNTVGKTTQVSFKEISCGELKMSTLRKVIANARQQGGVVVLFIDEVHNLNAQTTRDSWTLNDFLTQMVDLYNSDDPNSHVFLVAATNQPELLGTSLLVPGRFGKIIRFSYPNHAKRTELFTKLLPRAGIDPTEVSVENLVRQTDGFVSYGKLRAIINEARIKAESKGELVGQKHLQEAIDSLVHRFTNKAELLPTEKNIIATYQSSQALTRMLIESTKQVERITIGSINPEVKEMNEYNGDPNKLNPNKQDLYEPQFGAIITYNTSEMLKSGTVDDYEKECKGLIAGMCGQDLLLHTHNPHYRMDDMRTAIARAQEIILDGKRFEDLSENRQNEVKDAAEQLLEKYKNEVRALLEQRQDMLQKLIALLEEKITISGDEARAVIA